MKPSEYFSDKPTTLNDDFEFQRWFNSGKSLNESISSGFVDFVHKIFTNDFYRYLNDPSDCTALEIGFGGGRLMLPATFFFNKVIGIDIHKNFDKTKEHLNNHHRTNFDLLNDTQLDEVHDASINFVYSYIVFQHFDNWSIVKQYFKFLKRVMKPNSCGILYFGKNNHNLDDVYIQPLVTEGFPMVLHVSEKFASKEMIDHGFKIIDIGHTTKRPWSNAISGQFYIKFTI